MLFYLFLAGLHRSFCRNAYCFFNFVLSIVNLILSMLFFLIYYILFLVNNSQINISKLHSVVHNMHKSKVRVRPRNDNKQISLCLSENVTLWRPQTGNMRTGSGYENWRFQTKTQRRGSCRFCGVALRLNRLYITMYVIYTYMHQISTHMSKIT